MSHRAGAPGALIALVVTTAALGAGSGPATPLEAQASGWLPADHWSALVRARSHASGAARLDPVPTERTLLDAVGALEPGLLWRLAEERFNGTPLSVDTLVPAGRHPGLARRLRVELIARGDLRSDVVRPGGFTLDREWTGPRPTPDAADAGARLRVEAVPVPWMALTAMAGAGSDGTRLGHATIDAALGPVHVWGGRRRVGFRPGEGGGLVLDGLDRLDGGGIRVARPWPVPVLGAVSGELFAGPLARNGHVEDPWLLGMRVHARPHVRLDIGGTRAAVFGAMGGASIGARQVLEVLVGANLGGDYADDQVASIDARWRPPAPLPVELYGEWGMHDIDFGVLFDMPTFTAGVRLPVLPAWPMAGVSLEHTRISASCCMNPPWYHHFELADGWTAGGRLLGHPLGGHGHQWRLGVTGVTGATGIGAAGIGAVVFDAGALVRERGHENLFAPDREGLAAAIELAADARLGARASAAVRLSAERGRGWTELRAELLARLW